MERRFPGATTCILVGDLPEWSDANFSGFKAMLWLVDSSVPRPAPHGIPAATLQVVDASRSHAAIAAALDTFIARDPRRLPSVFVTESLASGGDGLDRAVAQLYGSIESQHRARVTRQKDGFKWQKHLLENLPRYAARRMPDSWAGALRGIPAFVCGAGPSLDASVGLIAANAERAVIFSADSALRALSKHGVPADFAVSIDAAKLPEKCLPADCAPGRVVLSAVSPPSWGDAVAAERQFFLSNRQVTLDWLAAQGLACTKVSATESCGSTALELARHLGCSPIFLFGLDLALDPQAPRALHNGAADASVYVSSGFDPGQAMPGVAGNYGEDVVTHVYGDLQALNRRLAAWPKGLVFNVNDRGAWLDNTTLVHPEQFAMREAVGAKQVCLARLSGPEAAPEPILEGSLGALRRVGGNGMASMDGLRKALAAAGPGAAAVRLRQMFADGDFGRALGSFSMKIMPHLAHPTEGDTPFWTSLLDEMETLLREASHAG